MYSFEKNTKLNARGQGVYSWLSAGIIKQLLQYLRLWRGERRRAEPLVVPLQLSTAPSWQSDRVVRTFPAQALLRARVRVMVFESTYNNIILYPHNTALAKNSRREVPIGGGLILSRSRNADLRFHMHGHV